MKNTEIKKYLHELNCLCITSHSITPLQKSTQQPEPSDSTEGIILCDFWDEARDLYLRRGQYVVLKTNPSAITSTKSEHFRVIRLGEKGQEIEIPSVYIGLTDCDSENVELAKRFEDYFLSNINSVEGFTNSLSAPGAMKLTSGYSQLLGCFSIFSIW